MSSDTATRSPAADVIARAAATRGGSSEAIYQMVARALMQRHAGGGSLLDIGCGRGELRERVAPMVAEYIGADVVRYEAFPINARFLQIDLDAGRVPLPDDSAEVVVAVETIEHLENPRAFFRELTRLVKPDGWILVTTPNQLSLLSKLTLLTKNQFNAFQEAPGLYPAHLTALLECDLRRIAQECGLREIDVQYSDCGRIPFSGSQWPSSFKGRNFSDNVLVAAKKSDNPGKNSQALGVE